MKETSPENTSMVPAKTPQLTGKMAMGKNVSGKIGKKYINVTHSKGTRSKSAFE
jgi:hypothetical protein